MVNKKNIIEEAHCLSDQISTQVRMVALGLIIIIWGFLLDKTDTTLILQSTKTQLIIVGLIALSAMILDFFQYVCGYINNHNLLKKIEKDGLSDIQYDVKAWPYRLRIYLFWGKQGVLIIALIYFGIIVIPKILP